MQKFHKLLTVLTLVVLQQTVAHAQNCDTTKYHDAINNHWAETSYVAPPPFAGYTGGYINGVNFSGDYQKANYFDLSGTSYTYILGAIIKFGKANSSKSDNLSKNVIFKIYPDSSGQPALTPIGGSVTRTLAQIKADVDAGQTTNINFPAAIALPSSKKFYVSVDISNFQWTLGGNFEDSLYIDGTTDDQVTPANTAWELESDSSWVAFPDNWDNPQSHKNPLDVNLWIFPYVSVNSSGCGLLPVTLLSFTAERKNSDVALQWQISNEINMHGYTIEKAGNNGNFISVGFVPALNDLKNQQYAFTDKNAFATSSTVQYRLRQEDEDGRITYSRVITLKNNAAVTDIVFANPFSGSLKLQINLMSSQKVSAQLFDMQGRLTATLPATLYNAGNNTITIYGTASIKPGTYILKLNAGTDQFVYKVVKQ